MKITFLSDNKTEDTRCNAEWGLSMLIETDTHKVLYDTGASEMFSENASAIGVDLRDVECCMISHGHYDHTSGMEMFCEINEKAPVYIHKLAFGSSYGETDGMTDKESCGTEFSEGFVKSLEVSGRLIKTEGVVRVNDEMTLVGNIPVMEDYKPTERFVRLTDGKFTVDTMEHEQFLVVEEDDGIHVISGCSHKGVVNILDYAKKLFPGKEIISLVGGFHTYKLKKTERENLTDKLLEFGVKKVVPLHCTGMNMIITLKERLGDGCFICCAGDTIEI